MSKRKSIIIQVACLLALGTIVTGLLSYYTQRVDSTGTIRVQTEKLASDVATEVEMAVKEYPAYESLIKYWYENFETLDIEYDVEYKDDDTDTEIKYGTWIERHPDMLFKYATDDDFGALNEHDKKLYAEVAYSWLITRLNQIKQSYDVAFLFCVLPNSNFDSQFFLFSAADSDSVRGTNYEEVYPIGISVKVSEAQQTAMRSAVDDFSHLAEAGNYVDYYSYIGTVDDRPILIGLTFESTSITESIKDQARHNTFVSALLQSILAVISLLMIYLVALKPLKSVQEAIRMYKNTKDSEAVKESFSSIKIENEIKELSDDVTDLAVEMDAYTEEIAQITKERERIGTELSLASKIQSSMIPNIFPPFPERTEFEIYGSMTPAKEVGGDFYDFFFIDDDHLCISIADVSGKGVPGALFMMASKILLENNAGMGKSPGKIFTDMNSSINKNNEAEMFVTVWLGILEISTGKLVCSNAGHEYPTLKRANGDFEIIKDKHGFVLGGMEGLTYSEYELDLKPGDKVFVYTDGVPEATNAENELFGTERMVAALNSAKEKSPEEILASVRKAVDDFVDNAEQFDDLTMMCIEYKGKRV